MSKRKKKKQMMPYPAYGSVFALTPECDARLRRLCISEWDAILSDCVRDNPVSDMKIEPDALLPTVTCRTRFEAMYKTPAKDLDFYKRCWLLQPIAIEHLESETQLQLNVRQLLNAVFMVRFDHVDFHTFQFCVHMDMIRSKQQEPALNMVADIVMYTRASTDVGATA